MTERDRWLYEKGLSLEDIALHNEYRDAAWADVQARMPLWAMEKANQRREARRKYFSA